MTVADVPGVPFPGAKAAPLATFKAPVEPIPNSVPPETVVMPEIVPPLLNVPAVLVRPPLRVPALMPVPLLVTRPVTVAAAALVKLPEVAIVPFQVRLLTTVPAFDATFPVQRLLLTMDPVLPATLAT